LDYEKRNEYYGIKKVSSSITALVVVASGCDSGSGVIQFFSNF
jgi:hypothetical protein